MTNIDKFNTEIKNLCDKFEALKSCKTKETKETLLKEYGKDKEFCKVIEFLLNDDKISGIGKSKLKKKLEFEKIASWNSVSDMLNHLVQNNTGPDILVYSVQHFLNKIENKDYKQIISDIVTKDYKCGVTDLTAYGFIPGLERNWRERKGHSLTDNKTGEILYKKILDKEIIAMLKLDGFRYKIIKLDNKVNIRSANGKQVTGLTEIMEEAKKLDDGIYDGECQAVGEFESSTARFNATSKILGKDGTKTGVEFVCFDYIEPSESDKFFNFEKISKTRIDRLKQVKEKIPKDLSFIRVIPVYIENKKTTKEVIDEIAKTYEEVVDSGEEGLIIDIADAPYERKKGNSMFKLKPEVTGDFKVVDLIEGAGKLKGMLGAFVIEYKNNTVHVPGGTEQQKQEVWNNKENYLNKLIEVTYFGETLDEKTKLPSLRLPRFKRFRHDKNDISYE